MCSLAPKSIVNYNDGSQTGGISSYGFRIMEIGSVASDKLGPGEWDTLWWSLNTIRVKYLFFWNLDFVIEYVMQFFKLQNEVKVTKRRQYNIEMEITYIIRNYMKK